MILSVFVPSRAVLAGDLLRRGVPGCLMWAGRSCCTAPQILLAAILRSANLDTCLVLGSLFQISTRRAKGQPAMRSVSSFACANLRPSFGRWTGLLAACAVIRLSASITNICISPIPSLAIHPAESLRFVSIHPSVRPLSQADFSNDLRGKLRIVWTEDCLIQWVRAQSDAASSNRTNRATTTKTSGLCADYAASG